MVDGYNYRLNFTNADAIALETPNACYKITLSGGSNYQLKDAWGNVLMSGGGTYQATMSQIKAGLTVYVVAGGSAPTSQSAAFVSTASPLVLDLDGNGVQTVAAEEGALFDLSGDGKQTVDWVERHDGLLVMDLNHNGQVDSGVELFGNATTLANGSKAADGWLALADQDTNHDGVVDAQDAHFADLRVWVDANGDGVTDAGELRSLADVGIISLNVSHAESSVVQNGNLLDGEGSFTKTDGSTGAMSDAWFQIAAPQAMDLSEVNTSLENGVKTVNLADGVAQKITLNLADVLATPAQSNGQHQLVVNADAKDVVSLGNLLGDGTQGSGQWLAQGVTEVNGNAFTVYQYSADSSLQVLLDQHLASGHVQFA